MNSKVSSPKISVIIPVYNIENYLNKCLASLVNQTFDDIEVIVIDDASTDNSIKVAEEYANIDSRIKIIANQQNMGISAVRNLGVRLSTGEFIHFVDGDDYLDINTYQKLFPFAHENSLDILLFAHTRVRNKKIKNHFFVKSLTKRKNKVFTSVSDKLFLLKNKIGVTVWNKLYKREFILQNNLLFVEGMLYEDIPWQWESIILANNISYINEALYFYVKRNTSIMGSKANSRLLDIIKSMQIVYEYLKDNNLLANYGNLFAAKLIKTHMNFLRKIDKDHKQDFFTAMQLSLNKMQFKQYISKILFVKVVTCQKATFKVINRLSTIKILH